MKKYKFSFRSSIRTTLVAVLLLLGGWGIIASLQYGNSSLQAYRQSRDLSERARIAVRLLTAAQHLAYERGRTAVVLRTIDPISAENRTFLDDRRRMADSALSAALEGMQHIQNIGYEDVRMHWEEIQQLRRVVDRDAVLPRSLRDPLLPSRWFDSASVLVRSIQRTTEQLVGSFRPGDMTTRLTLLASVALELRITAGAEASYIAQTLSTESRPSSGFLDYIYEMRGREDRLWQEVDRLSGYTHNKSLQDQAAAVKAHHLTVFRPLQDKVLGSLISGRRIPVSLETLTSGSLPTLDGISGLMTRTMDEALQIADVGMGHARTTLFEYLVWSASLILLLVFSIRYVMRRVVLPLEEVHDLYDLAPCGYHSLDEDGVFRQINNTELQWLGYERGEVIGKKKFSDFLTERGEWTFKENFARLKEQGWIKDLEFEIIRRDRTPLKVLLNATAVYDNAGNYVMSRAIVYDISDRKQAEDALRLSEQRYRTVFENSPVPIWEEDFSAVKTCLDDMKNSGVVDIETYLTQHPEIVPECANFARVVDVNQAALQLHGASNKEELLAGLVKTFTPESFDTFEKELVHLWNGGTEMSCEAVVKTLAGEPRHVIVSFTVCPGYEDTLSKVLVSLVDITGRKQAEEELLKLSSAIEQSPISIMITDVNGNIEFVNPKFTQITGYSPEEVIGNKPSILKSGLTPPQEYERLWKAITAGNVWNGTLCNRKKNGDLLWEDATISPFKDKAGVITHYMAFKEDITEKRKLEEQLRQSQKMEAIGTLAGGVAHDFNNILTAIIGYGEIIKTNMKPDDPQLASIEEILASSYRAAHLTRALLAFSRKQAIHPKPVDLNKIVKNMQKLLRRLIGEDVELTVRRAEQSLIIMADAGQIEQVLMNLATNARDAMPAGGSLTISTQQIDLGMDLLRVNGIVKPGKYVLVTVSDTGAGMDEQTRAKVFEPFFTTKEPGKGTGLGLAIVYGIVKQHNGIINVYSEPGKGTTFKIYLPLIVNAVEEAEPAAQPPKGTETILLAEDDIYVRRLTVTILKEYGYRVIEAEDGQDAIEKYQEMANEIDLLILDVIMPRKSGKEVADTVKALNPEACILFVSGYTADHLEKKGLSGAGFDFISKPLTPFDLLRKVRDVLDKKHGTEANYEAGD